MHGALRTAGDMYPRMGGPSQRLLLPLGLHFPKTTPCNAPSSHQANFQRCYLVFSVEIVVENSETFPRVAAPVGSANEVLYYQPDVDERDSVAREKGMLQRRARSHSFVFVSISFSCSQKATRLTSPSNSLQHIVTKF